MKRLTRSFTAKVVAVIMLMLLIIVAILSSIGIAFGTDIGMYYGVDSYYETQYFRSTAYHQADDVIHTYVDMDDGYIEERYSEKRSNLRFSIAKEETPDMVEYSNYDIDNVDINDESMVFVGEFPIYNHITSISVANPITAKDEFYMEYQLFNFIHPLRYVLILILVLSIIFIIVDLIFLFSSVGHRDDTDEIYLNNFDKIPFDILLLGELILLAFVFEVVVNSYYSNPFEMMLVIGFLILLGAAFLATVLSFAVRIKKGVLIKQLITTRVIKFVIKQVKIVFSLTKKFFRMLPHIWQAAMITLAIQFVSLVLLILTSSYNGEFYLILWLLFNVLIFAGISFGVFQMGKLKKFGKMMADGDFETRLDTSKMYFHFKEHGNNLNEVSSGMNIAIEERMKSEHLKTELITNVSHDIKTPLTSIISYVDLMKQEDIDGENIKNYLDVVDRQSIRLKNLLEDLVEVSKASTGNITVENTPCELNVLLGQVAGEYEEKLEDRDLELIISVPEEPLVILGDGRHLWRIFDNLLNNITKYTQEKTRVYLTLEKQDEKVVVTFRNISRYPLNITSEELMERFIRGDRSRHTEGSGLGLSIAKSLTQLQKGSMDIVIDGDLFKVILVFDSFKRNEV